MINFTAPGSYAGIVIDNVDPNNEGQVQVYIPYQDDALSSSMAQQINFVFPGNDNGGDLNTRELNLLKKNCVWAYVMQPIFGGSSFGRLDYESGKTTVSDSAKELETFQFNNSEEGLKSYGSKFNYYGARADAFSVPSQNYVKKGNYNGMDYFPDNYINAPKGVFSVPEIGAKVMVSFLGGLKSQAVITGKIPLTREIQMIYGK